MSHLSNGVLNRTLFRLPKRGSSVKYACRSSEACRREVNSVKIGNYGVAAALVNVEWPIVITKDGDHEVAFDARTLSLLNTGRRHLHVIGPSTPQVVGRVGGWIFDRAMAGWDVTVFIPGLHDARPLRILGAQADDYRSGVVSLKNCPGQMDVAVAAEVYERDASVHGLVGRMLDEGSCEVTIWGELGPADLDARLPMAAHRLSAAAAAFKKHALEAATTVPAASNAGLEVFYSTSGHLSQCGMGYAEGLSLTRLAEER